VETPFIKLFKFLTIILQWDIIYQVPATAYLNMNNVVQGYDFYDPSTRTEVVTRFFNVEVGKLDAALFRFPKQMFPQEFPLRS
jgi:hypothetical protein